MKRKTKAFATTYEEGFYNIMIIAMIIGIIITSGFVFYFRSDVFIPDEYFTSIAFKNPNTVPNKVKIGSEYDFDVVIKSHEEAKKMYNYSSTIELYKLYNYTESKYRCISRLRRKISLKWTNDSQNQSYITNKKRYPIFEDFFVHPNYEKVINWSKYTLEFGFSPPMGLGQLAVYYRNKTHIGYIITIDTQTNTTLFNNEVYNSTIDSQKNNEIILKKKGNMLSLWINDELIFDEYQHDIINGTFGLQSRDAYFFVHNLKVYRDSPYVVPDDGTVIEYDIDSNLRLRKGNELKERNEKEVRLIRVYERYNESVDCNRDPFYCQYFDLANDISFYVKENNLTKVVEKIPVSEESPNIRMYPYQKQEAQINWSDYTIDFSHNQLQPGNPGIIIAKFGDKWAIMITRNNSYFFRPENGEIKIDEIRNPEKPNITRDNVLINVTKTNITLAIDNATVFTRVTPEDYTNATLDIYIKNSFISIDSVYLKRSDERCNDPWSFHFCDLKLTTSRATAPRPVEPEAEAVTEYYQPFNNRITLMARNQSFDLQDYVFSEEFFENAKKDIQEIQLPITNPYIPDRMIKYNYATAKISNSTDFGFDYSYKPLDGARVFGIGMEDLSGNPVLIMYVAELGQEIFLYYKEWEEPMIIPKEINLSKGHNINIGIKGDKVLFRMDDHDVYTIENTNITEGQFYIDMKNTYAEVFNPHLYDKDIRRTLTLPQEDPCQLRTIYKKSVTDSITLEPGETFNITKRLKVLSDFDYGKVSFELYGSGGMPENKSLEIHAWLIKDDS